jgi:hypothetical protein
MVKSQLKLTGHHSQHRKNDMQPTRVSWSNAIIKHKLNRSRHLFVSVQINESDPVLKLTQHIERIYQESEFHDFAGHPISPSGIAYFFHGKNQSNTVSARPSGPSAVPRSHSNCLTSKHRLRQYAATWRAYETSCYLWDGSVKISWL